MDTPTPLEEALDYAEQRNWDLVEIVPNDLGADSHSLIRVNAGGRLEMLVEVGWGVAGLFANVRFYFEDQPVAPNSLGLGQMVTVFPGNDLPNERAHE